MNLTNSEIEDVIRHTGFTSGEDGSSYEDIKGIINYWERIGKYKKNSKFVIPIPKDKVEELATYKQMKFIRANSIKLNSVPITKSYATKLINEYIEQNRDCMDEDDFNELTGLSESDFY